MSVPVVDLDLDPEERPRPDVSAAAVGRVGVVLVSHDGARWLPTVLEGLAAQRRAADRIVAVDTGSRDASPELLRAALGEDAVAVLPGSTGYPAAVRAGVEALPDDVAWVWLLHDDSTPEAGALEELLTAAVEHPEAALLGPKLREWPSLRRLLELGVTLSGTGRRETGLERGEYDQGQHDVVRTVLAVNTAGLLVRRTVLEQLGGLDDALPVFGGDVDLGWRAAAAGLTTIVVPDAVVFHAEAAHRGVRRTPLTGRHTHYQERRAALWTLLANAGARSLPWRVLRLTLGTFVRMVGLLLVRQGGQALDELAALLSVLREPARLRAARRARAAAAVGDPKAVRRLLPPWWLPYRHGLDLVGDVLAAATNQAADVAERRRVAAAERDPSSFAAQRVRAEAVDDELPEDTGLVARLLTNPIALLLGLVVLLALVGARAAFGSVAGGGLAPAPDGAGAWWHLHLASWHPLGLGTEVPAPPYVLPLAVLATLLGGAAGFTVSLLLVGAVPFALWGAWRFLRVLGRLVSPQGMPRWLLLWGATTYALVPAASGAFGDGRLGAVVTAALLPWLAHAALGFAEPAAERRWRAAFRVGLLLAVAVSGTPSLWLFAVALGLLVTAVAVRLAGPAGRERSAWGPPATALALPVALLLPWWLPALLHGAAPALLLDAGHQPAPAPSGLDVLAGRLGDAGAPAWIGLLLVAAAVAALLPRASRVPVLVCWLAASVGAVLLLLLSLVSLTLPALHVAPGVSGIVVALRGSFVVAAVLGAQALVPLLDPTPSRRAPQAPAWARTAAAAVAAVVALVPLVGLGWFVLGPDDRLGDGRDPGIPAYMQQATDDQLASGPPRVLVLRGSVQTGLRADVRRGTGATLGEDEVVAETALPAPVLAAVRSLVAQPDPEAVATLARAGIRYVVLASPADGDVAAVLDATSGLVQASAESRTTRAWQVSRAVAAPASGATSWLRVVLLVVQAALVVVVAVQCGPSRPGAGAADPATDPADPAGAPDPDPATGRRGRRTR